MSRSPPGLHIVATPIGNLGDLSPRAADTLRRADRILAEDTRVTAKLLAHIGAKVPMSSLRRSHHRHERERIVERLGQEAIALVSDAGTPLISDPGYKLVRAARAAGHAVHTVPGPSRGDCRADAGRPADRPLPVRRLPARQGEGARRRDRRDRRTSARRWCSTRAGRGLATHLRRWPRQLGNRDAAVAREITKLHEECVTGTAGRAGRALCRRSAQGRNRDRRRPAAGAAEAAMRSSTPRWTKRSADCRRRAPRPKSPNG